VLEKVSFYQAAWVYFDIIGLFFVLVGCLPQATPF